MSVRSSYSTSVNMLIDLCVRVEIQIMMCEKSTRFHAVNLVYVQIVRSVVASLIVDLIKI